MKDARCDLHPRAIQGKDQNHESQPMTSTKTPEAVEKILDVGAQLLLPSGNAVTLLRLEGGVWICAFAPGGTRRGEVEFSAAFLSTHGMGV